MAESEHLKDFKVVWGDSCQSMWAELLALSVAESHVHSNYASTPVDRLLTDMFYVPALRGRLNDLRKDAFLERVGTYRMTVITNRIVVLSASFENYFSNFLDAFIRSKLKYFDKTAGARKPDGDKLLGEVMKIRGLSTRIQKFAELSAAKIKSVTPHLSYLDDVYMLRNVLAHRAGLVDAHAAATLTHLKFDAGQRITLDTKQLLMLAAPVIKISESLDQKI